METLLEIKDLYVEVEGKEILKGLSLIIRKGEIHAIMGPNGSGKSTLANVLMGHHGYHIIHGEIFFKGVDITPLSPDDRAVLGMFLAFQYPHEIPGVTLFNFLRTASNALNKKRTGQDFEKDKKLAATSLLQFTKKLKQQMTLLEIDEGFAKRYVNEGFSGGEKKRAEVLQMSMLEPQLAIDRKSVV